MAERPSGSAPTWLVWPFTVLLAGFGGAAVVNAPKRSEEPKPAVVSAEGAEHPDAAREADEFDPLRLVRDYFQFADPDKPDGPLLDVRVRPDVDERGIGLRIDARRDRGAQDSFPATVPFQFEGLIASVPDPIDSKFAYEFDATVEAIQWAFQARGFILHSSWLPWQRGPDGKPRHDRHKHYPGMMLFRRIARDADPAHKSDRIPPHRVLCLVCLVWENPVSGPHKPALTRALDTLETLRLDAGKPFRWPLEWLPFHRVPGATERIPIVGPYFTGSALNYRNTLATWLTAAGKGPRGPGFRLISGSASGIEPGALFDDPRWTFQATVAPTDQVTRAVLDYLADGFVGTVAEHPADRPAEQRLGKIAILRESNTAFGSLRKGKVDSLDLPFPVSVSQLQVDLDKLSSSSPNAVIALPTDFVAPRLPSRGDLLADGLPLQDRASSVAIAAQALRTILETIDREGVRVVGIVASDDRDVVFLNRLLKKHCPGVRVFATGPTAVMMMPAESYHMRGMVVGSTYPLFPPNQRWADGRPVRLSFASQFAQGVYNAVLAQFGDFHSMLEYGPPAFKSASAPGNRPPIWISIVGQDGSLVPVDLRTEYTDAVYDETEPGRRNPHPDQLPARYVFVRPGPNGGTAPWQPRPSSDCCEATAKPSEMTGRPELVVLPARAFMVLLALLAAVATGLAATAAFTWRRWYLFQSPGEDAVPAEYIARAVIWLAGWLTLASLIPVLNALRFDRHWTWDVVCALVGWTVLAALTPVAAQAWTGFGPVRRRSDPVRATFIYTWTLGLVLAVLWTVAGWDPDRQFLWLVRASDLGSGLSPVLPSALVAAALAVVGYCRLRYAAVLRFQGADSPFRQDRGRWSRPINADRWVRLLCGAPSDPDAVLTLILRRGGWTRVFFGLLEGWRHRHPPSLFAVRRLVRWLAVRSRAGAAPDPAAMYGADARWWRLHAGFAKLAVIGERWQTYAILVPFCGFAFWFWLTMHRTPETRAWGWVIRATGMLAGLLVAWTLIHFLTIWAFLKKFLDAVSSLPMAIAFERLPDKVSRLFSGYLFSIRPNHFREVLEQQAEECRQTCTGCEMAVVLSLDIPQIVGPIWERRCVNDALGRTLVPAPGEPAAPGGPATDPREVYVAIAIVRYISQYVFVLRTLALALTVSAPLLLLAAASYPFQPERPLLCALMVLVATVVVGILYVLYELNRNELISRVIKTPPNQFTLDRGFLASVGQYVLPIVGVAGLYLAGTFRVVLEPLLSLLR